MSGSFVRCLVTTAVLVTASSVQAAPEAPPLDQPLGQSASQPAVKAEAPVSATPAPAPAKAAEAPASAPAQPVPFTLERAPLPASDAKPLPPVIAEKPALAVQAPAPIAVPAKAAEAPLTPATPTALANPAAPAATAAANPPASQANPVISPAPAQAVAPFSAGISDEERAKQILANEQRGSKPKLHALQTESPDYNIIVCEAGCGDSRAHVIYKQPVSAIRSALADPAAANAALTKKAECRGGCDGNHSQKQASLDAPALLNDTAGSWMTTVEPGTAKAPAASAKPQASKSLKEDWMARINRERAAEKTAPAAAPSAPEENPLD